MTMTTIAICFTCFIVGLRLGVVYERTRSQQLAQFYVQHAVRVPSDEELVADDKRTQLELALFGEIGEPPRLWDDLLSVVRLHVVEREDKRHGNS